MSKKEKLKGEEKEKEGERERELEAEGWCYSVYLACSRPWVKSQTKEERTGVREDGRGWVKIRREKGKERKKDDFKLL